MLMKLKCQLQRRAEAGSKALLEEVSSYRVVEIYHPFIIGRYVMNFIISFYDEDAKQQIDICYYTSEKHYCYKRVFRDFDLVLFKRISEEEFMSAYDSYMNY